MSIPSTDDQFLREALDLARRGIGLASPNPCVGAVIVDAEGGVVGTGAYTYAGVKHAEILALGEAGAGARGGTLYINLEPHSHQGRTPPCTDALIAAGVRRVVACMADPNPKVSGRGFEQMRSAGVEVEVGQFEAEARRLNESFAHYIRYGTPFVTLKSAMTLDGKIASGVANRASGSGDREWITGEAARAHVQEQRHESDAILVGVGTIMADDPLLTDRSGRPRRRALLRVILDSHLRVPVRSRIVQSAAESDVLIFHCDGDEEKKRELEERGVRVEQLPCSSSSGGRLDMKAVLRRLGQLEITSLLIEGGAAVNGSALASGAVDKVFLYYAPIILGGTGAVSFVTGAQFSDMGAAPRVKNILLHRFGEDFAIEGYVRDPYDE